MGKVSVDINDLLKTIQFLEAVISNIETSKSSLKSKYDQLGQEWQDQHYQELGVIVDDCTKALNDVLTALLNGEKGIVKLTETIQNYESENIGSGGGGNPVAHTGSSGNNGGASTGNQGSATSSDPHSAVMNVGENWTNSLPKDEYYAVRDYTGPGYTAVNEMLRGIRPDNDPNVRDKAVLIHQALSRSQIPCDCTVYRGCSAAFLGSYQNLPDDQLVGAILTDDAFMSTSLNRDDSFNGAVKLEISVPAGARGAYVGFLSFLGHQESEVLFDGGRRLCVTGITRNESGQRIIQARMLL